MPHKICAGLLFILSLSPFTAPFSTCDLAVLLGHGGADNALSVHAPTPSEMDLPDTGLSPVLSAFRLAGPDRSKTFKATPIVADQLLSAVMRELERLQDVARVDSTALPVPSSGATTILRL